MATNGKAKGKRGEREAAELLTSILGMSGVNHDKVFHQVHEQSGDIISIPGLSIEIKRQETLLVTTWWKQAERQAEREGVIPVLMYRQNRRNWRICLPAYLLSPRIKDGFIEVSELVFAQWLNLWMTPIDL